jgi:hypothetical protein
MKTLPDLIGADVLIHTVHPLLNEGHNVITTKLLAVESGGIWIEGQGLAKWLEGQINDSVPKMPIFFVPYAQIVWILEGADYPHLSEKALGLSGS